MIDVKNCPFCRSEDRVKLQKQDFNDIYIDLIDRDLNKIERYWFTCQSCSFIYRSPKLDADEQNILYKKYRDVSFRNETPDDYFERITGYDNQKSENYKKVKYLIDNTEVFSLAKDREVKVLDVGCGGGVLLHKVKEMFPKSVTYGVEPNELYSDLARRKSNAREIKTGYFSSELFKFRFDVVLLCDVLEHVDSPDFLLNNIYSALSQRGVLFLEVPSPTNFNLFEPSHDIFNMAHHVFYTKDTLRSILEDIGFIDINVVDIEYKNNAWKLRVTAKKI